MGLGALGVITKVTLDLQPTYTMRQYVYQDMPLSAVKEHFDAIESSGYSVSLFTDWKNQRINEVWIKIRDDKKPAFDATPEFFGAKRATRNLHPIVELSAENCTEQMGVPGRWYQRLPHFRMGFTPSAGKELQSEYFVPRKDAVEAVRGRTTARPSQPALNDYRNSRDCGRHLVDESLLPTGLCNDSLYLETGLASGEQIVARD